MRKLTERVLDNRPTGRVVLSDHQVNGLRVRGGPRGWVFWFQEPELTGKDGVAPRAWRKLGTYSVVPGFGLSLADARRRALELQGKTPEGVPVGVTVRALT